MNIVYVCNVKSVHTHLRLNLRLFFACVVLCCVDCVYLVLQWLLFNETDWPSPPLSQRERYYFSLSLSLSLLLKKGSIKFFRNGKL